jgi:hypothetical protein
MSLFNRWKKALFDFSEGEREQAELARTLQTALDRSRTNEEFEAELLRQLDTGDARETQMRWGLLMKQIIEFQMPEELGTKALRGQAERYPEFLDSGREAKS